MKPIKYVKGMAMLEVLIAMLVFALALIPLVRLQVKSMDATRAGFYKTETAAAAESMMDYLMTDVAEFFPKNKKPSPWEKVIATSGEDCDESTPQQKMACDILNSHDGKFHANGNAVLCVFGKRPPGAGLAEDGGRDQYLISIRAIWYSGKRENGDENLTGKSCGANYDSSMSDTILAKENIDSIKIDMAY